MLAPLLKIMHTHKIINFLTIRNTFSCIAGCVVAKVGIEFCSSNSLLQMYKYSKAKSNLFSYLHADS